MKVLKIAATIVIALLIAGAIASFVFPTTLQVTKSIEINAPRVLVYQQVSKFSMIHHWSPWTRLDPNMKSEVVGEDGTVGAVYKWESEMGNVGVGEQEFKMVTEDTILTRVTFTKPFKSKADAYMVLEETGPNTTKVTWGFTSHAGRPANVIMGLMDAEGEVGNDYQRGLDTLKAISENVANNKTYNGYKVEVIDFPETHFATTRDTVKWEDLEAYYASKLPAAYGAITQANLKPGTPCGIYYNWDIEQKQADMGVGVAISPAGEVPGLETVTLSGNALKINYYGAYDKVGEAHAAMDEYLAERRLIPTKPMIELYITDPGNEPDTTKWLTEVYYLIK